MRGDSDMYRVRPVVACANNIELPDCMYKVKNIHSSGDSVMQNGSSCPDANALEQRQVRILQQLEELKSQLQKIRIQNEGTFKHTAPSVPLKSPAFSPQKDVVINANPSNPPWSVLLLYKMYKDQANIGANCHIHSSVPAVADKLSNFFGEPDTVKRASKQLLLTVVWKNVDGLAPRMVVNPLSQLAIEGEVNIARYLSQIVGLTNPQCNAVDLTEIDSWLDFTHSQLLYGSNKERQSALRQLNSRLGKNNWLVGSTLSVADVAVWSALYQVGAADSAPANVKRWLKNFSAINAFSEVNDFILA